MSGQGITLGPDVVPAICEKHLLGCNPSENTDVECAFTPVQSALSVAAIPDEFVNEDQCDGLLVIPHMPVKQLRADQQADPCLRETIAQLETGNKVSPNFRKQLTDIPLLIRQFSLLELHNEILYRTHQVVDFVT